LCNIIFSTHQFTAKRRGEEISLWGKDREAFEKLAKEVRELRELIERTIEEDKRQTEIIEKHTDEYWSPENIIRRHEANKK
jgi:hypothetical protein